LRPRVITVHGIWSAGKWQEDVAWYFRPHFDSIIVKYRHYRWLGAFNLVLEPAVWIPVLALTLLHRMGIVSHLPSWGYVVVAVLAYAASYARRDRAFAKFLSQAGPYAQPASQSETHLIAHSLGSYLAGHALKTRGDFHVGRVILVGCVLPRKFPWPACRAVGLDEGFKCLSVRNELSRRDVVVWIAWAMSWVVLGLGRAGLVGFKGPLTHKVDDPGRICDSCSEHPVLVHNIVSKYLGHSGTFVSSGYAEVFWLPFLWGVEPAEYADFLKYCRVAAELDREWSEAAQAAGHVDERLVRAEKDLRARRWRWTEGTFEEYVRKEVVSRFGESEDTDELVSQAVSGIWKLVRQALEARLKRIERRKSQQPEDISLEAEMAYVNPKQAVLRAVKLLPEP